MIITNEHFGKENQKKHFRSHIAANDPYDAKLCVCLTQSSVISIIHRNVGRKSVFRSPKYLLLLLVF